MRALALASYNLTFVANVDRFPAVGETLPAKSIRVEHGGKGSNQAIGLSRLGAKTQIIASVGNDAFGDMAIEKWKKEGIDVSYVRRAKASTGMAFVYLFPDATNAIIISKNANELLEENFVIKTVESSSFDVFLTVFEVKPEIALKAAHKAKEKGLAVLNPAPALPLKPEDLKGLKAITPNETEIKIMAGLRPDENVNVEGLAELYSKYVEIVAVTLAEKGSLVIYNGKKKVLPPYKVKPVDVTGAGDAWNAAFTYMIAKGEDPFFAADFANAAAAFLISRTREDKSLVENLPYENEVYKIMEREKP